MRTTIARWSATLFSAALLVAPVHAADAQLGGLLKKAKEKAADAAAGKAVDRAADKAGIGAAGSIRTPTFSENVLEITDARFDQLVKGLHAERAGVAQLASKNDAAEREYRQRQAAYDKDVEAYQKQTAEIGRKTSDWSNCMHGAAAPASAANQKLAERLMAMSDEERAAFQQRMEQMQKRMQDAERRGDRKAQAAIADTVRREMGMDDPSVAAANQQAGANAQKCGPMPEEMKPGFAFPAPPVEPERPRELADQASQLDAIGARAAGLTVPQYGVLRERVGALLRYPESKLAGSQWAFSKGERDVVANRGGELKGELRDLLMSEEFVNWSWRAEAK